MNLPQNGFKRALAAGKAQIGLWSSLSSNYTVEVIAGAGFDWILLDTEHSPNDLENLLTQLQAAAPYPTHPVVRVPWNDMVTIKRVLDAGAQTLLLPFVQDAREAARAVAHMRYPPQGVRGVAGTTRATRYGMVRDYARRAADELFLIVQIETAAALEELPKIAATPGVDSIFIGPSDLAASMGHLGDFMHADVQRALENAAKACRKAGVPGGCLASNPAMAKRYLDYGYTWMAMSSDLNMMMSRAQEWLGDMGRGEAAPAGR
jgi:4-hydroxy-2-oxoheptanedioate aldolase